MARVAMTPVSMNQFAFTGTNAVSIGAVAPAAGIDAAGTGGTTFGTAWPGISSGVTYLNNGTQWLWGYNGANACTAYILVGQKAAGQAEIYTAYSAVLPVSGYFYLGPFSPQQFNQTDASQFAGGAGGVSPGGVIGQAAVGYTCVDFLATTLSTVALRLYQLNPVQP
jgi:hypothetical protein